ncbi:hypothetical protein GOODEAATRI_022787 [Goodea atripinnis]|uniref:Uncharacterized protein n=1 Tax=Goodea atripinnis TaxID=208336 RepID=A0ABV0MUC9_9TELE
MGHWIKCGDPRALCFRAFLLSLQGSLKMDCRSEGKKRGRRSIHVSVKRNMVNFSSMVQTGKTSMNRGSRLEQTRRKLVSLETKPLWVFICAWVAADGLRSGFKSSDLLISDGFPALSSSSRDGQ